MKVLTWSIIVLVLAIGGYTYYSNRQAQEAARQEAVKVAVAQKAAADKKVAEAAAAAKAAKEAAKVAAAKKAADAAAAAAKKAAAMTPPFGTKDDVGFAGKIWSAMLDQRLAGPDEIHSAPYEGTEPHGMMLELFISKATIDGRTGDLIVKRNFGPAGVTKEEVTNNPDKHLGAITVIFRREAGFDPVDKNWFWAKFLPDGSLDKNGKGMSLAGKVAKGKDIGCISCHSAADGGDMVYSPVVFN